MFDDAPGLIRLQCFYEFFCLDNRYNGPRFNDNNHDGRKRCQYDDCDKTMMIRPV